MVNLNSNFFKTNDYNQIFYQLNFLHREGETINEPLIVLNYGLVCSTLHWKYQLEFLDQCGFKILLHDYRGHFQSTGKDQIEKLTFKQMAQDTHDLIDFLGAKQVILMGHSMGVNICLEMYRLMPSKILKIILISGTIMPVRDVMFNNNLMQFISPVLKNVLGKYPRYFQKVWGLSGWNPLVKEIVKRQGFNAKKVESEFIEVYLNRVGELGPEVFFQLYDEMGRHDILGFCSKINCPVLIIGGDQDKVIPPYLQRVLHKEIKTSEFYLIHTGSHVPQVDFHEHVNQRIDLFLR